MRPLAAGTGCRPPLPRPQLLAAVLLFISTLSISASTNPCLLLLWQLHILYTSPFTYQQVGEDEGYAAELMVEFMYTGRLPQVRPGA